MGVFAVDPMPSRWYAAFSFICIYFPFGCNHFCYMSPKYIFLCKFVGLFLILFQKEYDLTSKRNELLAIRHLTHCHCFLLILNEINMHLQKTHCLYFLLR